MTVYRDLDSPQEMSADAASVSASVSTRTPRLGMVSGVRFADYRCDQPKRVPTIDEATTRLAAAFDRA